jgi:GT2 family glycosyltransferase
MSLPQEAASESSAPVRTRGVGPGITAAICTRDRPGMLERSIASLLAQSEPPDEIVVVDNAPASDATRQLVAERYPKARYRLEPRPGLDVARNAALGAATHEIVAFLDDDVVADTGWCAAFRRSFAESPTLGVCTGRVEALSLVTEAQRLFEANGGFARGHSRIRLADGIATPRRGHRPAPLIAWAVSVGSGCSFAVRRGLALELGGFDEALDQGPPLPAGGDHDLLWRALEAGFEVIYEPEALAWHEHRADLAGVADQIVGHQRGLVAFLVKNVLRPGAKRRAEVALFLLWRLAKPSVRLARRAIKRDPLPARLLLRMGWNCWLALGAYPAAARRLRASRGGVSSRR